MFFITVRIDGASADARRAAIDTLARSLGGRSSWRTSRRAARSYGLLELPGEQRDQAFRGLSERGAIAFESPVIALAVFPAAAEALPCVEAALNGPGRPAGVLSCEPCGGGLVIEWDLQRTTARVVLGLVDVELRRFHSGRTAELLTPLAPAWIAAIAADGLQAEGMSSGRVLEELLERVNLGSAGSTHV